MYIVVQTSDVADNVKQSLSIYTSKPTYSPVKFDKRADAEAFMKTHNRETFYLTEVLFRSQLREPTLVPVPDENYRG